jgi:hypothetical protein
MQYLQRVCLKPPLKYPGDTEMGFGELSFLNAAIN